MPTTFQDITAVCSWCERSFQLYNRNQLGAMNCGRCVYCSPKCSNAMQASRLTLVTYRGPLDSWNRSPPMN